MRWKLLLLLVVLCALQVESKRSRSRKSKSKPKKAQTQQDKHKANQQERKKKERKKGGEPNEEEPKQVQPSESGEARVETMKNTGEVQEEMKKQQAVQETTEQEQTLKRSNALQGDQLEMLDAKNEEKKLKMQQHCDHDPAKARRRRATSPEGDAGAAYKMCVISPLKTQHVHGERTFLAFLKKHDYMKGNLQFDECVEACRYMNLTRFTMECPWMEPNDHMFPGAIGLCTCLPENFPYVRTDTEFCLPKLPGFDTGNRNYLKCHTRTRHYHVDGFNTYFSLGDVFIGAMYEIRKGREEMWRLRRDGGGNDDKFCAMTAAPGSDPEPEPEKEKHYDCTDKLSPDYPCTTKNELIPLDKATVALGEGCHSHFVGGEFAIPSHPDFTEVKSDGTFGVNNWIKLCQTLDDYKETIGAAGAYATLYDMDQRIPIYSAVKISRNPVGVDKTTRQDHPWTVAMLPFCGKRKKGVTTYDPLLQGGSVPVQGGAFNSLIGTKNNLVCDDIFQATDKDYKYKSSEQVRSNWEDERGQYARGHLLPSALFNLKPKDEGGVNYFMKSTFIFSNAAPQISSFNSQEWARFEALMRAYLDQVLQGEEAYYIVGTMGFNHDRKISDRLKNTNAVKIPKYYWTAFCYPNTNSPSRWGMDAVSFVFVARNLDVDHDEYTQKFSTVADFDRDHFQSRFGDRKTGDPNSVFGGTSPLAARCQNGNFGPHFERLKQLTHSYVKVPTNTDWCVICTDPAAPNAKQETHYYYEGHGMDPDKPKDIQSNCIEGLVKDGKQCTLPGKTAAFKSGRG